MAGRGVAACRSIGLTASILHVKEPKLTRIWLDRGFRVDRGLQHKQKWPHWVRRPWRQARRASRVIFALRPVVWPAPPPAQLHTNAQSCLFTQPERLYASEAPRRRQGSRPHGAHCRAHRGTARLLRQGLGRVLLVTRLGLVVAPAAYMHGGVSARARLRGAQRHGGAGEGADATCGAPPPPPPLLLLLLLSLRCRARCCALAGCGGPCCPCPR
jgi:hypothetical protein